CLDLEQDLAAPEGIARLLQPADDAAFLHGLAEARQGQSDDAHSAAQPGAWHLTSHDPVSAISWALGTEPRSRAGETGIGISSPATRTTGSSRWSKLSSWRRAESSAEKP